MVELQSLGTNAISIIPYGFLQEMNTPAPFRYARGAGSENDESVIKCAYVANQLGMSAMLKPQLWTWKGWTGDLEMSNEEDWQQFLHTIMIGLFTMHLSQNYIISISFVLVLNLKQQPYLMNKNGVIYLHK